VVSVLASYFLTFTPAPDDRYIAFGIGSHEFTIKPISGGENSDIWNEALAEGIASWNAAHPDINITISNNSLNRVAFTGMEHEALYSKVCLPFACSFIISIDNDFIDNKREWIMHRGKYYIVHELGHALGLNDVWYTPNREISIMSDKNNNGVPRPRSYDIQLVSGKIGWTKNQTRLEQLSNLNFDAVVSPVVHSFEGEHTYEVEAKKRKEELAKVVESEQNREDARFANLKQQTDSNN
jgi:hypothetical protein